MMRICNLSWADIPEQVFEIDRQRDLFVKHVALRKPDNNDFDLILNHSTKLDDHIVDVVVTVLKKK